MAVDKNLFLYDLAVVAIMKNESLYVKEWLDYHLLAGVNHFYIYDNDSTDNFKEVLQPYIDKGIVTYIFYPGKIMQIPAYNDALKNYKFFCRYMAFIDADEFIFPQSEKSISEATDEILSLDINSSALAINMSCFGSNNQVKADYSRGVLERFTRRAPRNWTDFIAEGTDKGQRIGNHYIKLIMNPRKIKCICSPHIFDFFKNTYAVNEHGKIVTDFKNDEMTADKITLNHYHIKSKEEFEKKVSRGRPTLNNVKYDVKNFDSYDRNEEFDNGILKYGKVREKIFGLKEKTFSIKKFPVEKMTEAERRISETAEKILLSDNPVNCSEEFFEDKMETFFVCLAVSEKFKLKVNEKFLSEYALFWIYQTLIKNSSLTDIKMFMHELPKILRLPYPIVKKICSVLIKIIPQVMENLKLSITDGYKMTLWRDIWELDYILNMLEAFDVSAKK